MLKKSFLIFLMSQACFLFAQEIPIGVWRDHLPYSDAVSVTEGNGVVYTATESTVFSYNKSDFTFERLNLANGLSDIGISKVKFNPFNNTLVVAYLNGNIDVIDEDKNIINLSFIKNSNILGGKNINNIFLQGKIAYLSTDFGIVLLDTDDLEIVDTYLFGPLGSFVVTNSVTLDNVNIYAATNQGVFFADRNSANLNDYNVWSLLPDLGTLTYSNIVSFSNRLFVSLDSPSWLSDTVYYNDLGIWQKFIPNGLNMESIDVSSNHLIITQRSNVSAYDLALTKTKEIYTVNNSFTPIIKEAIIDADNLFWYAEDGHGLIKSKDNWNNEIIRPNGPSTKNVFAMDFVNDELWTVSGGYGIGLNENLMNHWVDNHWSTFKKTMNDANGNVATDFVNVAINPENNANVFIGSWNKGLFELNNKNVSSIYTGQNSVLDTVFYGVTAVGAMTFDNNNNLWVTSSFSNTILAVKTPDNLWYNYSFTGLTSNLDPFTHMIVDANNYKWILMPDKKKILIFDDNNTLSDKNDDRTALNSNFPGNQILSITKDNDGEIWLGTDEGIAVFYNPSDVFDDNIKADQIFVQQDGQTQVLLETETITTIAVDGANRKWIGTQNSGVFLMSEDGTEQIEHFTTDNSPLFSNNIFDIVINPKTGEIFFGTEKGLVSYKGTATEPDSDFNNVFVYPNPVKPDFNGTIAIRGLVKDTDVRITDISGNIVYKTTSLGGQAVWNGKDFNGNKVQTGVYMVFNGSPEGELKAVAKILFIH